MKACIGVILIVVTYCYCDVICNDVSKFNVKWTSISNNSRGSMPIGNGDVALNVWTQSDGIYYYIAKNDAWSETSRLLKIGGIKIIFDPNPFDGGPFSQILDLATGRINITAGGITSLLWVDANSPVISMTFESTTIAQFKVFVEPIIWRKSNHTLTGEELQSARGVCGNIVEPADIVLTSILNDNPTISWYHRNTDPNNVFRRSLQRQGLDNSDLPDPLLYLAFGATLTGESTSFDGKRLISRYDSSLKRFYVSVSCQKAQSGSDFIFSTFKTLNHHISNTEKKLSSHIDWWNAFWNRSCIQIDSLMNVTSFYILERWMEITGGGRGKYPLKFNGLLYNTDVFDDNGKVLYNADYRKWGGGYWFQNTRFMYWAMLASGDLESMMPLFDTFMNIIPLAQLRTRRYYGHDGIYIPETFWFWGTFIDLDYGCNHTGAPWRVESPYMRYHINGGIEVIALMLDYFAYTKNVTFAKNYLVPFATQIFRYFDQHYEMTLQGKLAITPAQSIETWQQCINPTPDIAGMNYTLVRVLNECESYLSKDQVSMIKHLIQYIPNIPINKEVILPAEVVLSSSQSNIENAELYTVFPFRIFGVGAPQLHIAKNTYAKRLFKNNVGWSQDVIDAALLGLANEAADMIMKRINTSLSPGVRWITFNGPFYDYLPEVDHGAVTRVALQYMLMQPRGDQIILFPTWKENWDVSFKLVAPYNTIVEATCKQNRLTYLKVKPEERINDITFGSNVCNP